MIAESGVLNRKTFFNPTLAVFLFFSVFFSRPGFSAETDFFNLNEKWEKSNLLAKEKGEALDQSFKSALSTEASSIAGPPPAASITRSIDEILQSNNATEIELNQSLFVKTNGAIVKFLATDEGIVSMETANSDVLRILGSGIGTTFVHLWDSKGRNTFEVRVIGPKFVPSKYQISQTEALEKSRSFKFGYDNSQSASYTGPKFREMSRSGLDFTQNFSLSGDSPYGTISSHAQVEKYRAKTLLNEGQVALTDGKVGPFKNFNLALGDSAITPDLLVFPTGRVRGGELQHWDDGKNIQVTGFGGREQASIIGTLTPGIITKRSINSDLAGAVADVKVNDQASFKTGLFGATGSSRPEHLHRSGEGVQGEVKFGPHVIVDTETDYDSERFAQKHSLKTTFDRIQIRNEVRDISKNFFTMVGAPSRQGEIGYLLNANAQPWDNTSFSGDLDIFRDRLIPNPEDPESVNIHTDLSYSVVPRENSNLTFTFQDLDDTGRLGPSRQRSVGGQYNQRVDFFGRKATFFSRYQNRGNRVLTNSLSNFLENQVILGFYTELFWGINFSIEQEWNALKEPNINRFTRPRALTYTLDYNHQIGDTPFYMDARLRIRDEEDTESQNSFMSGEDSTEVSGSIYYREYDNLEVFLTGSFSNFVPESLNITAPRVQADFFTGMRYIFDTDVRWSASGTFEGFVFNDKNGDGIHQPEEPGIPNMLITANDGQQTVTDTTGFYQFKSISGKKAVLTLDSSKIPYGYAPTSSMRQELSIIQHEVQTVNFSLTPRSEITGIIYNDLNGNGKYDLTDVGIRGVKVVLEDKSSARSNGIGVYSFSNASAGEHTASLVLETIPEGYLPENVPQKSFTVTEGIRYELNFPLKALRTVTGRVFMDDNRNGILDPSEKPLAGVKVSLGDKSVVSDQDGWYLFDDLGQGHSDLVVDTSSLSDGLTAPQKIPIDMPADPKSISDLNIPVTRSSK